MTSQDTLPSSEKECQKGITATVLFYFLSLTLVSFLGWGSLNLFLEGLGGPVDGLLSLLWLGVFFVVSLFFSHQLRCSLREES
ncbi:hypothetical protein EM20IM_09930 [Candidatus Methylacidiphilum infernorum]|uniref:Uncharacterized protein n=1 Tax=Candidatus Methylacidiphilum infernorum TaxID=511746 RepID=A0ABX7PUV9_9BACT|nr:hypothetical protein [Candidatus Methylacidiphilum infernorum]QSR86767.1 hypothetical protein EM20IM_09930 [Candidatus Methylacidiphilum infernorum]